MQAGNTDLLRNACLIGGDWLPAQGDKVFAVHNPANNELLAQLPDCGEVETRQAITAAALAWPAWRQRTAHERGALLKRWHALILAATDDLAALITAECGKPLAEARAEVAYGASFVEWFAEEGKRAYGETIPSPQPARRLLTLRQPVGVCAVITPWNFPLAMITRKLAPALAAGCVVVAKPAEQTPLTALALAVLAERAGIPAGVINVVTGSAASAAVIGQTLCDDPRVRKLSFTGSTEVGRRLMAQCAPSIKKLSLELGGNAPFIVFDDADLDAAVEGALLAKFRNAGQTCVCANRLYVQQGIHDRFVARLAERVQAFKLGDGAAPDTAIGPLIDAAALSKVEALVADAVAAGARVLSGGQRRAEGGNFYLPTVLTGMTAAMRIAREEIFGPVAPVFRFADEAEAVALANDSEYGLAAYVYTRDLNRALRVAEALETGMVGINTGIISNEVAPFGGIKQSGIGREGSRHGLDEYLEIKYLCIDAG
ncbi:NAD-dependent succinate-semialdehyde dehydrogenase [Rhodocyclus tenuis]|uniref:Succinate-semialdehyde dehydrogenase/glutarate-semialdehyde dehydrogenase n=1 Tax=Rhodocyclus tenuis TaxID=1066 RepID=A0A840G7G1_RHOTE|nr:NAD-dependent succinate-semialdehyde dehydrogenase [Rhodocyclus tenuis]MBB4246648.1 succinate-semialdehyde dehydrogenase/glutarate-semialdehyde dehydrogenase [Rhodocyclus tenuis]